MRLLLILAALHAGPVRSEQARAHRPTSCRVTHTWNVYSDGDGLIIELVEARKYGCRGARNLRSGL